MMLGIAASLDKDVKLGDVVVAQQVDAYASNLKAVPDEQGGFEFQHRGSGYQGTHALLQRAANLEFAHAESYKSWRARGAEDLQRLVSKTSVRKELLEADLLREQPGLERVHLASGAVVGAAKELAAWIHQRDASIKALEMEAAGVVAAAHERVDPVRTLVLTGISDLGDERKSQLDRIGGGGLRKLAMRIAAHVEQVMVQDF